MGVPEYHLERVLYPVIVRTFVLWKRRPTVGSQEDLNVCIGNHLKRIGMIRCTNYGIDSSTEVK
jgi:hypothetical protein